MICFQMPRGPATLCLLMLTAAQTIPLPTCAVQYLDRATAARKASRRAVKKAHAALRAKRAAVPGSRLYKLLEQAVRDVRKETRYATSI